MRAVARLRSGSRLLLLSSSCPLEARPLTPRPMCARRFLTAVFILTLLVVASAFAIYQWGGNVLLRSATPTGHFEASAAGSAPDYSKADSWIGRPDSITDPTDWLPDGFRPAGIGTAAIFYIHPTTYLER